MVIYTIGFAGKTEDEFYKILRNAGAKKLIDVRLWPNSIGEYFAWARGDNLAAKCKHKYGRIPELCPTSELLTDYKNGTITWPQYEIIFNNLLRERQIENLFTTTPSGFAGHPFAGEGDLDGVCFLCSEKTADQCHRRLVAEYLVAHHPDTKIVHL